MNISKYLPPIYFVLGLVFAGVAYYLSLMSEVGLSKVSIILAGEKGVGSGVDIAADGGALGFAILSGVCFACCAYLTKK